MAFFDIFKSITFDWSKVNESDIELMLNKLNDQDIEKVYKEMISLIESNNKKRSIVAIATFIIRRLKDVR